MANYTPKETDLNFDKVAEEIAQLKQWAKEEPDNASCYYADIAYIEDNIRFLLCIDGYPHKEYNTWDEAKNGYDDWMYFNRVNYERYGMRATIERCYE